MNAKWTLTLMAAPFLLAGCQGALWGNIAVLGVTVGIFYGTLSLGRTAEAARSASTTDTSHQGADPS